MPKYTFKEQEFEASLRDGIITIQCIDWVTMKEYICDIGSTFLEKHKLIDTLEDLYDLIITRFESKNEPFHISPLNGKIVLSYTLTSKYKFENFQFVLENKKNVDAYDELNNRMKYYQKKMEEMESVIFSIKYIVNNIIGLHYIQMPDGHLIATSINHAQFCIDRVTIKYDQSKKQYIILGSELEPKDIYVNTPAHVLFILSQFQKGINILTLEKLPTINLAELIPAVYMVKTMRLINMVNLSSFDNLSELNSSCSLYIIGSYCQDIKWKEIIDNIKVSSLFIDTKIPVNGIPSVSKNVESTRDENGIQIIIDKYK